MSEIKALEKLRKICKYRHLVVNTSMTSDGTTVANLGNPLVETIDDIIGNIEAEIADRFIELPTDADGEAWHLGDAVYRNYRDRDLPNTVNGIYFYDNGEHEIVVRTSPHTSWAPKANEVRHDKERTVEDVLRDVWKEALDYAESDIWRNPDEVFAERADEIRELLGGDE